MISGFKHLANKKTLGNQHLTTTSSVTTEIQGEYSSVVTLVKKRPGFKRIFSSPQQLWNCSNEDSVQRPQRRFKEDYLQAKFTTDSISALSGYIQARSWKATYQWLEIPHAKTNHGSEPQTNSRMPTLTNSCSLECIIHHLSTVLGFGCSKQSEHIPHRFPRCWFSNEETQHLKQHRCIQEANTAGLQATPASWTWQRPLLYLGSAVLLPLAMKIVGWTPRNPLVHHKCTVIINPRCSMYGIFTYIWVIYGINVGKYSIHWAYGNCYFLGKRISPFSDKPIFNESERWHLIVSSQTRMLGKQAFVPWRYVSRVRNAYHAMIQSFVKNGIPRFPKYSPWLLSTLGYIFWSYENQPLKFGTLLSLSNLPSGYD